VPRTDSTRYIDTLAGPRRYAELAPDLARAVEEVCAHLAQAEPTNLVVTAEWLCGLHHGAFGRFVSWAGQLRDRNVQIGDHEAPAHFELPTLIRNYCADIETRLSGYTDPLPDERLIGDLAFAEGRFLFIHPFRDFNGRTARMLLFALLVRLGLPPVRLVPTDSGDRKRYLTALAAADNQDYRDLEAIWTERLRG
jgi:CRISPR-associated endonuclease/helicase Cas3